MTLRVSGKNLDIGEAFQTHVRERIDEAAAKYSAGAIIGHVTIGPEGSGFRTDCTLHLDSGITLQVEADAQEPYASFNRAADRIEKRLRRYRRRLRDHHGGDGADRSGDEMQDGGAPLRADATRSPATNSAVIAESLSCLKEMSVSTAVMELDQTNAHFFIFRHSRDGRVNLVYRRADGNIGWIDALSPAKDASP